MSIRLERFPNGPPYNVRVGRYLLYRGARWIVWRVVQEENRRFQWLKVTATWSGIGMMPLWHKETYTFLLNYERKPQSQGPHHATT